MKKLKFGWILGILLLQACQQTPAPIVELPSPPPLPVIASDQVPSVLTLTQLSASQQAEFTRYLEQPMLAEEPVEERVSRFLTDYTVGFEYISQTLTAEQTMARNQGNCVSLALFAKGLADTAKVPISFRLTYRDPVLDMQQDLLVSANHVRSYLHGVNSTDAQGQFHGGKIISIDYFPEALDYLGPYVSANTFMAMVYNNLAAEALLHHDLSKAMALTVAALTSDPSYPAAINLYAVLLRRAKQPNDARVWYDYGLQLDPTDLSLLSNYQLLLEQVGDTQLAAVMAQRIDALPEGSNPYAWYSLAVVAENQGDTARAIRYYQKLLEKAPNLQPAVKAIVRLFVEQGNLSGANRVVNEALATSYLPEHRKLYEQKKLMLSKLAE